MNFNEGWKFAITDDLYAHSFSYDDSNYQNITIPHDFSISQPYNKDIGDGCTGYLIGGIGWYRKSFEIADTEKKYFIYFDGIYNRSSIYINEQFVKFHPYGYSPILIDITQYIVSGKNLLCVKVDRTRHADSRWYAGAGIYRKCELLVTEKTYIPKYGVEVVTNLENKRATVSIATEIVCEELSKNITLHTEVVDCDGSIIATLEKDFEVRGKLTISQDVTIGSPLLWDIYHGNIYTVHSRLYSNNTVLQNKTTTFGIRECYFDAQKGFFLNGKNYKIKGVCLHHDCGLVGVAVPLDVWKRRLETLKECGVNAIRTAHNPASSDFLDLCDRMGFLVQEEFYDEWDNPKDKRFNGNESKVDYITRGHHEFFKDYAKDDLQNVVKRDKNHPSIIQWSIGNEIEWTYPKYNTATGYFGANASGNYFWDLPPFDVEKIRENIKKLPKELYEVGDTASKLARWTREIDYSRPIIANCILPSASYESGYTDALDMVGFSYRQIMYERCHENYPEKPIMGTENLGQWHEWKACIEKDYISGIFLWTGIDYIGESGNVDVWPTKATRSGLLDVAGFKKPSFYMFKSLWQEEKMVHIATQTLENSLYYEQDGFLFEKEGTEWQKRLWVWQNVNEHYNYTKGEKIVVEVYSNYEELSLYQNDTLISTKTLNSFEDRVYKWCIPFVAGQITLKSENKVVSSVTTAESPSHCVLRCDKNKLVRDLDSVCHIEVQLIDSVGNNVTHSEEEIEFVISDNAKIYGVDNGSAFFVGDHFSHKIVTNNGKALVIIGAKDTACIEIFAKIQGNKSNIIKINA